MIAARQLADAPEAAPHGAAVAMVFGPPSAMTTILAEALRAIVQAALPECAIVEANTLDDWEKAGSAGTPFIAVSQYPSPELCARIEHDALPSILVVDHPLHSLAHLAGDRDSDLAAVRAISASFACLAGKLGQSQLDIQTSNTGGLEAFFARLSEISGIAPGNAGFERIEARAGEMTDRLDDAFKSRSGDAPADSADSVAQAALSQLGDVGRAGNDARIEWPGESFFLGDSPGTAMQAPVELAGPCRCVLYGPYMHLPPGRWSARLSLDLAECEGEQPFTVEVICGEVIARGGFHANGSGSLEVAIEFSHRDPHVPIELRLFLGDGAIYGRIDRFDVSLELAAPKP